MLFRSVWMTGTPTANHFVDVTETFDKKIAALHAHASQTAHNKEMATMVRAWGERNAALQGLAEGRLAEIFRVINTD